MDELKKLAFDIKTYQDLIKDYTSDPYITQTVDNLDMCITSSDFLGIKLFLGRLKEWYTQNINKITNNQFVINTDSHLMACEQIHEYYSYLKTHDFSNEQENDEKDELMLGTESKPYNIFISHSSKDEKICTAFVHLLEVLGVPEKNILYSSSERFGIPADMNIFNYLKSSIAEHFTVYYMLSDNYYNSVYCLNEMGAAWINQNDFSTYLLPNLTKRISGVVDANKKAYRLDNSINLNQLREKISSDFGNEISNNKWDEEKVKFLNIVNEIK